MNKPLLVEPLLDWVLGKDIELELLAGDSGFDLAGYSTSSKRGRWLLWSPRGR